jgi:NTE family protein
MDQKQGGIKMNIQYFTENREVRDIISNLKTDISEKSFSDVIDKEGNQYVDLVQEGGGVLGIALLGYTYVLERVGIRFFSLAGTSAGAINTLLLAACDAVDKPKTEKIIELIVDKNLYDFVDGPFFVQFLLKSIKINSKDESSFKKIIIGTLKIFGNLLCILPVIVYVLARKGLNRGSHFRNWISDILQKNRIDSTRKLLNLRQKPEGLTIRQGVNRTIDDLQPKLKIIAAEITTETRVIFPEMNLLFWNEPGSVNPADYVRASMSIPLFFHPLKVKIENNVKKEDWNSCVKFKGDLPRMAYFVDGGILSNFPIDVFHKSNVVPRLPTFGVKLGDDRHQTSKVGTLTKFLLAIFNSARHVLDYQFLLTNDDYEHLIQRIDIGEHNWLNFSISDKDKLDLFIRGAKAADEFLRTFDWEEYKKIRESMINKFSSISSL